MQNISDSGWKPLAGVRIADFSLLLPGPVATLILADLGAEVIKVEPQAGDPARGMKSAMFAGANRNKSSLALDLKSPDAGAVVERLAEWADVAIEGFRPGVADRLGIGAARLQAIKPALVFCSLSGFGQTGPMSGKPGHDLAYLAMGGGVAHRGQLRQAPSRASLPMADIAGAAFAAIAILAALHERREGRKAAAIDLSLYESVLYCSAIRFGFSTPASAVSHLYPANDLFECADGERIALTIVEPKFWEALLTAAGEIEPRLRAPEYATEEGRLANAGALMALLDTMLAARDAADWITLFDEHDVPAEICVTPQEAIRSDHARARALHLGEGEAAMLPFPVLADGVAPSRDSRPAPDLGADGARLLAGIGCSEAEIAALFESGAVLAR
ncbi:MAG: CoA transferase [Paracoccaceae bacterium]